MSSLHPLFWPIKLLLSANHSPNIPTWQQQNESLIAAGTILSLHVGHLLAGSVNADKVRWSRTEDGQPRTDAQTGLFRTPTY